MIDDPESYAESSCTAMFVCAFARGIKYGWLSDEKYVKSACLGWEALLGKCIDSAGNIYGVCVGSGQSFRRDYYKNELPWNINDTHGTGIVPLAGTEVMKMLEN